MKKSRIKLVKSISVMLCILMMLSSVPAMAYNTDYMSPNSCGAGNHVYAGRVYDSSGNWTNTCTVCGTTRSDYDPSFSYGGSYAQGTPRDLGHAPSG